jgi:hypothetical protein
MSEQQMELVPSPPKLTPRQLLALDFIRSTGNDGATATEIGMALGGHPDFHRSNGAAVAKALKRHGAVRQRKGGLYVALDAAEDTALLPGMSEDIPY